MRFSDLSSCTLWRASAELSHLSFHMLTGYVNSGCTTSRLHRPFSAWAPFGRGRLLRFSAVVPLSPLVSHKPTRPISRQGTEQLGLPGNLSDLAVEITGNLWRAGVGRDRGGCILVLNVCPSGTVDSLCVSSLLWSYFTACAKYCFYRQKQPNAAQQCLYDRQFGCVEIHVRVSHYFSW